ncbi:hypothetical protein FE782_27445 [Paenibacillus antri]|uniref:Oligogalacturonate lyase domain-containing protein n=1 Tax=Paenibacillus antri TaxID=2582848 RepID=A0A5R9GC89_9BACL|nr:hypothetical protein [Paenibacillus antri]TLS49015.1 hypothetical protein FE782_27445 [Paenibacillus antri]
MLNPKAFPRYRDFDPLVPVWCVTPGKGGCIHRFFDTSPFSPSGKYLAVLRLPREDRLNLPGESADIVVVDLETGEERVVASTSGWEAQLGANLNWGSEDSALFYNDVDLETWEPFCVKLNFLTGEKRRLEGGIYRISPDGRTIVSASLERMRRTQDGYGVVLPDDRVPRNFGLREDDGLYATDVATGKRKLLASIRDVFDRAHPRIPRSRYEQGECYGFHCKFNPQGDRLLFTMRWYLTEEDQPWNMLPKGLDYWVVTMRPDGSDIAVAVGPELWRQGGHHINWFPDGERLSMNLRSEGDEELSLVQVNADGTGLRKIVDGVPGSGHPTVHPDGVHILTDAYENEKVSFGDGTVPLRWIDAKAGSEKTIVRINVGNPATSANTALRVDPHPAWDSQYKRVAFNGYVNGTRRVFVADLSALS